MNVVYLRRKKGKRLNGKFIKPVFRSMGCTFGDEPVYQKATHNTATHAQERRTVENQYPYAKFSDGMFFRVEGDNIKMDKVYENRKPLKIVTDGWNEVLLRRYGYSAT